MSIDNFVISDPSNTNVFRSIVLFGRNAATYKFALATSLLHFANLGQESVPLSDLAGSYSEILCHRLKIAPKQGTSSGSKFLTACNSYNDNLITLDELIDKTITLGFENVLDAFHRVGTADVPARFFIDQRKSSAPSIAITSKMMDVALSEGPASLQETDARWSLVETAWALGLTTSIIGYDENTETLHLPKKRKVITSARSALNGYQKGRCFYCYRNIEIVNGSSDLADIDHVFPHVLQRKGMSNNLDGVWNLVLACQPCNRGENGKFDATPSLRYIERLNRRNEYLILSAHPLRETLIHQTGDSPIARRHFLQANLDVATQYQSVLWETPALSTQDF